jgi:hypothetical protein
MSGGSWTGKRWDDKLQFLRVRDFSKMRYWRFTQLLCLFHKETRDSRGLKMSWGTETALR